MKRHDFLKGIGALISSYAILGCEPSIISEFTQNLELDDLDITEARKWFEKEYLQLNAKSKKDTLSNEKYKRNANWDLAKKYKDKKNQDFIWVPIEYQDSKRPAIVHSDKQTEYKQKLPQYFYQALAEGLVVIKEKGANKMYLSQISYDPSEIAKSKKKIDVKTLSGWLLLTEWNDNLIEGSLYENGKKLGGFKNISQKKLRPDEICNTQVISYQTVDGLSCGPNCIEVVVTLHTETQTICYDEGGSGGSDNWYYYGEAPWQTGGGGNSGSSASTIVNGNSQVGQVQRDRLNDALWATGLAVDYLDLSYGKSLALAKSLGGTLLESKAVNIFGNVVGGIGLVVDTSQLVIGLANDGFQWNEDGVNLLAVGLGITGLVCGGWIAVGCGATAVVIAHMTQP